VCREYEGERASIPASARFDFVELLGRELGKQIDDTTHSQGWWEEPVLRLKKKLTRLGRLGVLGWVLVACAPQLARAEPARVLLLEPAPPRRAFAATLQIQLVGLAELVAEPQPSDAHTTAERVQAASELARRRQLLAVVWAEPARSATNGPQLGVLYVVGEREGRALVEVVRLPGGAGPDLDRALALKLREIVAELIRANARAPSEVMLVAPVQVPPSAAQPAPDGAALHALLFVGPRLALQPDLTRGGLGFGAGPVLSIPGWRFCAALGLDWLPARRRGRDGLLVRFSELAPQLRLRAQLQRGPLWLGVQTGLALALVEASGSTRTRENSANVALISGLFAIDLELPISRGLAVAAALELQAFTRQQRFAVNEQELVDLGRLRTLLGLELRWHWPP
jgi:hypothetical protein